MQSQNGWSAFTDYGDSGLVSNPLVPGTDVKVLGGLRAGSVATVLLAFASWFDKNVEPLEEGQDEWGFSYRNIRGSTTNLSNHSSGTAMDLNSQQHPLGSQGTFSDDQTARIRAKLREYNGVIRWGGDYSGRKDEMHFEINTSEAAVAALASRLSAGTPTPPPTPVEEDEMSQVQVDQINQKLDALASALKSVKDNASDDRKYMNELDERIKQGTNGVKESVDNLRKFLNERLK